MKLLDSAYAFLIRAAIPSEVRMASDMARGTTMFMMIFSAMSLAASSFLTYAFLQLYWLFVEDTEHRKFPTRGKEFRRDPREMKR